MVAGWRARAEEEVEGSCEGARGRGGAVQRSAVQRKRADTRR